MRNPWRFFRDRSRHDRVPPQLVPDGCFFFTVNLAQRRLALLTDHVKALRAAFRETISAIHSRSMPCLSRLARGERGIWQLRYWEHTIRDDVDFARHVDYVHINPVKHGLVDRVRDWAPSSFHRHVELGNYPVDWAGDQSDHDRDYGERGWSSDGFRKGSTHPTSCELNREDT